MSVLDMDVSVRRTPQSIRKRRFAVVRRGFDPDQVQQFPGPQPHPRLQAVSNGVRLLMVHCPVDISNAWQVRATVSRKEAFQLGGNLYLYATGKEKFVINRSFDAPKDPVVIDQQNCRYHPHVFGLMVGQPLQILNSDSTLHNIHALPAKNAEFNTGQPIKGMKTDHLFTAAEQMVPFKCDVHGWMNAYAGVMSHPFFATTGDDGTFTIKGLPPGTYKLAAWHEKLGKQTADVTLAAKDEKENNFTFKAGGTSGN